MDKALTPKHNIPENVYLSTLVKNLNVVKQIHKA